MHSRVSENFSTIAMVHRRSSGRHNVQSSFRKRAPFGSSKSRCAMGSIPPFKSRTRVPVNGGEVKGWKVKSSSLSSAQFNTLRSSRSGREQTSLRRSEGEKPSETAQEIQGRVRSCGSNRKRKYLVPRTLKHTTLENAWIQPPSSATAVGMTSAQ